MCTPDKPWEVWITDPDGTRRMNARFDGVVRAFIEIDWYRKRGITAHMRHVEAK